jgi:hypothetical protein
VEEDLDVDLGSYTDNDALAETSFLAEGSFLEPEETTGVPLEEGGGHDRLSNVMSQVGLLINQPSDPRALDGNSLTWGGRELPFKSRTTANLTVLLEAWYDADFSCPAPGCDKLFPDCSKGEAGKNMRYSLLTDHWFGCHMENRLRYACPFASCGRVLMTAKSLMGHYQAHYTAEELPLDKTERSRFINGSQEEIRAAYAKVVGKEIDPRKLPTPKLKRDRKSVV